MLFLGISKGKTRSSLVSCTLIIVTHNINGSGSSLLDLKISLVVLRRTLKEKNHLTTTLKSVTNTGSITVYFESTGTVGLLFRSVFTINSLPPTFLFIQYHKYFENILVGLRDI